MTFEPARWPNGPEICEIANLPAFETFEKMRDFQASLCSSAMKEWRCRYCGRWHYWGKPFAPSGTTSGTSRQSNLPPHTAALIERTKE